MTANEIRADERKRIAAALKRAADDSRCQRRRAVMLREIADAITEADGEPKAAEGAAG